MAQDKLARMAAMLELLEKGGAVAKASVSLTSDAQLSAWAVGVQDGAKAAARQMRDALAEEEG